MLLRLIGHSSAVNEATARAMLAQIDRLTPNGA
jgi:hypothetical protein